MDDKRYIRKLTELVSDLRYGPALDARARASAVHEFLELTRDWLAQGGRQTPAALEVQALIDRDKALWAEHEAEGGGH